MQSKSSLSARVPFVLGALGALALTAGCSARVEGAKGSSAAASTTATSDTDCRVVLREAGLSTYNGGEVFTDPASSIGYVVFRGDIDVDTKLVTNADGSSTGAVVNLQYSPDGQNWTTVQAQPCSGNCTQGLDYLNGGLNPPQGFTRFSFATQANTFEAGVDQPQAVFMIPYVTVGDAAYYDHNRTSGNYDLVPGASSPPAVTDDFSICPTPDPQALDGH